MKNPSTYASSLAGKVACIRFHFSFEKLKSVISFFGKGNCLKTRQTICLKTIKTITVPLKFLGTWKRVVRIKVNFYYKN